jgi:GH15 family glucan-1,4-alpha-glucosidase
MPRPIVVGNGNVLLGIDDRYRIRDLFYPQVGLYNHLSGNSIRMGVWVSGLYSWIDEDGWTREFSYEPGTLTAKARLLNESLGLQLDCDETVMPDSDVYVRRITVTNLAAKAIDLRIFFSHDLHIMESDIGDTAFYNPFLKGVVHYKGPNWFLFGGRTATGGVAQYATGIKGFGGLQGTWRDAEDGALSMNPIAQGSVDSTVGLHARVEAASRTEAQYWIVCGRDLAEITSRFDMLKEKGVRPIIEESSEHWRTWSGRLWSGGFQPADPPSSLPSESADTPLSTLAPEHLKTFARQSLLILKTQIDNQGGILAANDSDIMETNRANYSYVWPRDGALVAEVLDTAGHHEEPERFFRFCAGLPVDPESPQARRPLLSSEQPFFLQKYRSDGTFGASWHFVDRARQA